MKPAPVPQLLRQLWEALEARSDHSYFTSWAWIGCWLEGLEPSRRLQLLTATRGTEIVGLGLLLGHAGRRLKLLPSPALHLHATGDPRHDDLAIEHNGVLVHRTGAQQIAAAMYRHLIDQVPGWDRLELPGLSESVPFGPLDDKGAVLRERTFPSHYVDLAAVRARGSDYLGLLSSNTRSQIRRSLKAYGELAPVELTQAPDVPTALAYLAALKSLHQRHWLARSENGAFANPLFEAFHTRQVVEQFEQGHVQLLRVHAGAHDIGYLYNFIHRGQVLFYQSGFDYDLLPKHGRPGLVTHALAIQHNAALGHTAYDFLAGSTRYKQSLGSSVRPMVWTSVHRDTAFFRIEEWLRKLKRSLSGKPVEASAGPPGKRDAEVVAVQSFLVAGVLALVQAITPGIGEALTESRSAETTVETRNHALGLRGLLTV